MNAFRCLGVIARSSTAAVCPSTLLRPSIGRVVPPQSTTASSPRTFSMLTPRRPMLPSTPAMAPPTSAQASLPSTEALDLLPKPSMHPGMMSMQIRCGPRDTYNPSHLVRKRRHGFLSRLKTKNGRKMIMRRLKKKRWSLSH
ncbi:hypothetical protein P154DRAFT_557904 [Amniculicola lignicola CBS 123094]|uniref:Large ribosomal subunit protein bL34m n=1 Tax=Amniculicola lignicola CBS 123094 TaxID=1392246 RepID=A0A6A5VWH5_9PLEO|nr:hypothetical protein P154DRAFT_557904 [Amniculicola lignicola CBS 123094]